MRNAFLTESDHNIGDLAKHMHFEKENYLQLCYSNEELEFLCNAYN